MKVFVISIVLVFFFQFQSLFAQESKKTDNINTVFKSKDVFTSSDLPIIVINTNNINIPDTPKINANMGIIYNGVGVRNYLTDSFNNYNNKIGIELRGSTSLSFPQKSYSIETRNINGLENDTAILGMPSENSWILYAPYNDKTCLRNVLAYSIANKMGNYAVRTKYCELVLNGQYMGIYVWMEKIKRDTMRVNISKLKISDTIGDQLTGGYIVKIDKPNGSGGNDGWNSLYKSSINKYIRFLYDYPDNLTINTPQKNYIKSYIDSFEVVLKSSSYNDPINGYRKYIDVNSFIDYIIVNEISKNVDSYRLSAFLYKDRYSHGGKLYIGPVWDYNIAWWNANYCGGNTYTGWAYNFNTVCSDTYTVPFWWAKLMQDTTFKNNLKCRYTQLRQNVLSNAAIFSFIDSTASILSEAQNRHFAKWQILGVYTWPNPTPYASTYAGEITTMKNWIQNRLNWIDANLSGNLNYPIVNLGSDTLVCPGQLVLNAGNTGSTYLWNNGSTQQNITVNNAALYVVSVNKNGCIKTDSIIVDFKPIPNAFAGNDTSICQGKSIALSATGGVSYQWNNNVLQNQVFIPVFSQNYTVTVTSSNGCTAKDSIYVQLINIPFKPSIDIVYGDSDTLISSAVYGNQWFMNGNLLIGETQQKLIVSPYLSAFYSLVVTDNTCSSDTSDYVFINVGASKNVEKPKYSVFPNPFKDYFVLDVDLRSVNRIEIQLFDVNGRTIFEQKINTYQNSKQQIRIDATQFQKGFYYLKLNLDDIPYAFKMIRL